MFEIYYNINLKGSIKIQSKALFLTKILILSYVHF